MTAATTVLTAATTALTAVVTTTSKKTLRNRNRRQNRRNEWTTATYSSAGTVPNATSATALSDSAETVAAPTVSAAKTTTAATTVSTAATTALTAVVTTPSKKTLRNRNHQQNILLEGVADRDWGIAFSVVNGRINKGICLSDLFILQK